MHSLNVQENSRTAKALEISPLLYIRHDLRHLKHEEKAMLQAELASSRLSLEETQEAGEAPHSDDNDDGVSSFFSPSLLLPPCHKIADVIMTIQHRRGARPWGVKTTCAAGLAAPLLPLGVCSRGVKGEADLDLGRSNFGEDTSQEQCRGQGKGGEREERTGVRTATYP
jgi:hypothetical protein